MNASAAAPAEPKFVQGLGLVDSAMLVAGSMIGSGIFIVSADIARQLGSAGWLLAAWVATGLLTLSAALSYGELAAMMPRAGGQYVYLREAYSPLWGFLYGWTLFLVIQTGTIAAVAVAFARYLGVLAPGVSPSAWIVPPVNLSANYAISLSCQQLTAILLVVLLTLINARGLQLAKLIQNVFTSAKGLSLLALIVVGLVIGRNPEALKANFADLWTPRGVSPIHPDFSLMPTVAATSGALGLLVAFCAAQVGTLFSSDAWNNITFTAGEVKNPRRNLPLSLAIGTAVVTALYVLANVAYLCLLPLGKIQRAPDDRVATAAIEVVFSGAGPVIMAVAIMISTFGCNNGLILAGARVYYAMARDGLFFRATGRLNSRSVPAAGLALQCLWTALLILPRTRLRDPLTRAPLLDAAGLEQYGNLYSTLLDYVIFAVLIFYVLTIAGLFTLRRKRPDAERPYRAFGYPLVPALYIAAACVIMAVLLLYKTQTSWPGLLIVLNGVPAYFLATATLSTIGQIAFSYRGRISRAHFWAALCCLVVAHLDVVLTLGAFIPPHLPGIASVCSIAWLTLFAWVLVAIQVKRWHDLGVTGWAVLISLVPFLNALVALIVLGMMRGKPGANEFGADPLSVPK